MTQPLKTYTHKQLHALYGKVIHAVHQFDSMSLRTVDGYMIETTAAEYFDKLLNITVIIHSDQKFREKGNEAYHAVYVAEFEKAVKAHTITPFMEVEDG